MSNGGEIAEEKPMGNEAYVAADEGESCLSRGDPPEVTIPKMT